MILAETDEAADAALARRSANSQAPFPISQGLRNALIEQDKRNVGGEQRPANVGGVLPISFCGGPDRIVEQIRQAREEIGVGVLDLSLADPGTAGDRRDDGVARPVRPQGAAAHPRDLTGESQMSDQQQQAASPGGGIPRGICRGGRVPHPLLRGGAGGAARASARRRRTAPQRRARSAGHAVPRHRDRDAGVRAVRGEHQDPHDAGTGGHDRQGRRRARPRSVRSDGNLVRRQGGAVACGTASRAGPRAGARSPGRDPSVRNCAGRRHARADGGPALCASGAHAADAADRPGGTGQAAASGRAAARPRPRRRTGRRRCVGSTFRRWCCSGRSTA